MQKASDNRGFLFAATQFEIYNQQTSGFMNITIIGTGLMGCSLGLALKKGGHFITGVDHNPLHLEQAESIGAIDKAMEMTDALVNADLVVIGVPVDATVRILPHVLNSVPENATVMDLGSTKLEICNAIRNHHRRGIFVPVHPIDRKSTRLNSSH